jgi:hypothetical protein
MTETAWQSSYPSYSPGKTALIGLLALLCLNSAAEERLVLESGPGQSGPLAWDVLRLVFEPHADGDGNWQLELQGMDLPGLQGSLTVICQQGGLRRARPWCGQGRFEWRPEGQETALAGRLFAPSGRQGIGIDLFDGQARLVVPWTDAGQAATARVKLDGLDLAALPEALVEVFWSGAIEGQVDGTIAWNGRALELALTLTGGGFDSPDGRFAGAGLALTLGGEVLPPVEDSPASFSFELAQQAGELLVGALYVPEPDQAVNASLSGRLQADGALVVTQFKLDDSGALTADGGFELAPAAQDRRLERLVIDSVNLNFPAAFVRWGEGLAGLYGVAGLDTQGRLAASLDWQRGQPPLYAVDFESLELEDDRGRFSINGLNGRVESRPDRQQADIEWQGLDLFRLAFGPSTLQAAAQAGDWRLREPLVLPLLDGGVVIESMALRAGDSPRPAIVLDARIDPLELTDLTRMLGLPEFGGSLSGRFPGIVFDAERIAFTGGIDVQAFSGGIRLRDLVIERPFGSLPALAAQVEFERLDLAQLTGAFNFGHMEGQLSGWMRDLRLLDWQPAAMDARLFTHEDAPSRRISQRAVENLSRLGGGAAALGTSLLSIFDEFPYRRAGLACRLDRNICHMDGVAAHANGGYYIVEGRLLPRLDIIGHRRLVDWPMVVAQLVAATRD